MRLIDADNVIHALCVFSDTEHGNKHFLYGIASAKEIVNECPTIDAVSVVRCGECAYNYGLTNGGEFNPEDIVCGYFATDGIRSDDFCSRGKKMEDKL